MYNKSQQFLVFIMEFWDKDFINLNDYFFLGNLFVPDYIKRKFKDAFYNTH